MLITDTSYNYLVPDPLLLYLLSNQHLYPVTIMNGKLIII
jgi:hypothetical protein